MRSSKYLFSTLKANSNDINMMSSSRLMLRAGIVRKLSSGLYIWLPTGVRVLKKVKHLIREEMTKAGALEVSMPLVQPSELWKNSGRWLEYGMELLRFKNRSNKSFILSPTHEEAISYLIQNEISSYKELPINLYQIQNKFRDEMRPRFGVIRTKEFIMKDGYSFHVDRQSLQITYADMYQAYKNIFNKMKLNVHVIQADNGNIGGDISHEFQVVSKNGENEIVFSSKSNYISNINFAKSKRLRGQPSTPKESMRLISVPDTYTISDLIKKLNLSITKIAKTFIVRAKNNQHNLIALIIRGDHTLSHEKIKRISQIVLPLDFISSQEIKKIFGTTINYLGPINLSIPYIIDYDVALMSDFAAGANIDKKYFLGINWHRDLPLPEVADLRKIIHGDISPDGKGFLKIKQGMEIAHIFQLGDKYSKKIKIQSKNKCNVALMMGCYGIGITRIIAAIVEQHHDNNGILWPEVLAPFRVAILPINMYNSIKVREISEKLYYQLSEIGIDVLFNDLEENPGIMFANMELIGIPHILIVSDRTLLTEDVEYKNRKNKEKKKIKINDVLDFFKQIDFKLFYIIYIFLLFNIV